MWLILQSKKFSTTPLRSPVGHVVTGLVAKNNFKLIIEISWNWCLIFILFGRLYNEKAFSPPEGTSYAKCNIWGGLSGRFRPKID